VKISSFWWPFPSLLLAVISSRSIRNLAPPKSSYPPTTRPQRPFPICPSPGLPLQVSPYELHKDVSDCSIPSELSFSSSKSLGDLIVTFIFFLELCLPLIVNAFFGGYQVDHHPGVDWPLFYMLFLINYGLADRCPRRPETTQSGSPLSQPLRLNRVPFFPQPTAVEQVKNWCSL